MSTDQPFTPDLPATSGGKDAGSAFAVDGTPFDPDAEFWKFKTRSRGILIDFRPFDTIAAPELIGALRVSMRRLVETRNLNSGYSALQQFRALVRAANLRRDARVAIIDSEDVLAWVAHGSSPQPRQLQMLADAWRATREGGFLTEALDLLGQIQVPARPPFEAVTTWDPQAGPFRPMEDAALKAALDAAFNDGTIDVYDYALARLFRGLGIRPSQAAAMKVCDLRRAQARTEIHIPLAKQRGRLDRGVFMPWKPLAQGLSDILFLHIEANVLPHLSAGADHGLAPLFPAVGQAVMATQGFDSHLVKDDLTRRFTAVFAKLNVISPLTNEKIRANPRRERHTVLTGLAMMGCTAAEIAANAGQTSVESCQHDVDASIDHHQRMESLVGPAFVPVADRFLGQVVRSERDARAAQDPNAILRDRTMDGVSSCAVGGCSAIDAGVAPIACYTCRRFRAWRDAPHEALLEMLIADRTRLVDEGHAEVAETRMGTIVAIADLIERIREYKEFDHG